MNLDQLKWESAGPYRWFAAAGSYIFKKKIFPAGTCYEIWRYEDPLLLTNNEWQFLQQIATLEPDFAQAA